MFLDGLAVRCQPAYIFMVDCGTCPEPRALVRLYRELEEKDLLGACAGEIEAQTNWCNMVVSAQVFEYKISHILQKPLESILGYVTVLPGAFSVYRWVSLADPDSITGASPLDKYFQGLHTEELGPFTSNIYLAEDRVLCFELLARKVRCAPAVRRGPCTGGGGGAPLTHKRHPPQPAQPRHTNDGAPRTRKQHQQEHRPQRPTERSDPQHAKGRMGDCPGPRKETAARRNVAQGVIKVRDGVSAFPLIAPQVRTLWHCTADPEVPAWRGLQVACRCRAAAHLLASNPQVPFALPSL